MKVITVNEPKFVAEFQCAGSQCIDHCCQGWNIVFDKKSVNKYLKSPVIEIKNIAADSMVLLKKSHVHWARVKFNENRVCSFMDEDKLCKVHALMGPAALSPTCASYPRSSQRFKSEENKTLTLSCPEATRALLTADDAMQMISHVTTAKVADKARIVNQHDKLLNLMSMHLVNASQAQTQQGLYAIASLLLFAEKHPQQVEDIEAYFNGLMHSIESGEISQHVANLECDNQLQWSLLLRLQSYLGSRKSTRSLGRINWYVARLLQVQTSGLENNNVAASMERLAQAWSSTAQPWLNERPHVMRNYIMYRLYNDQLPDARKRSAMSWLYLLTAEWFLIKSLIAAAIEIDGEISEKIIIDIIYSFHAVTKHNAITTEFFFEQIEKVKVNDDLSLLYLLA
ncbi:flagellin lysine-N-methylase [Pantoea sp. SOD02]|uniref:flagellin lysine-N-methylase n=1 Tax=Pantoea sp. SOD02 TaxID=2970818 RepID=UPI00215735C6|nr:flagellin lysine-N-methylase [Pantoea sp. SOD02]UVC29979.1 flagellin lysine-N-methylase [Pantoea sp. SOD02]